MFSIFMRLCSCPVVMYFVQGYVVLASAANKCIAATRRRELWLGAKLPFWNL